MPKLFVGAWLPPKVQRVLDDYPRPDVPDLRWSTAAQWLVSIRPLGDVEAGRIPPLVDALRFELDGAPAAKVAFGRVYREGWLMVEVDGLEELTTVVFEATTPIVPPTHRTDWHAQVVLGRGRATKEHPVRASWTVRELVLAKATRSKDGPGYETVEAFLLG